MPKPRRDAPSQPLARVLLTPPAGAGGSTRSGRPASPIVSGAPALSLSGKATPATPSPPPPALPALFAHPPGAEWDQLHEQVYAVVALALRAYVQAWYVRFSPRDGALLPAINSGVVAPLTRTLLALDRDRIHRLVLSSVPAIAATHLRTLRAARAASAAGFAPSTAEAYHARLPLLAVELAPPPAYVPAQGGQVYALAPTYLAALVDSLLATALPEAEYASDAERLIVREVLARSVLGNIGRRLSAPWFWATLGLKLLRAPEPAPAAAPRPLHRRVASAAAAAWTRTLAIALGFYHALAFLLAAYAAAPAARHARVLDPWRVLLRETAYAAAGDAPTIALRALVGTLDATAAVLSPAADRLVPHLLDMALTPQNGVRVVALLERVLFPDGWPTPPPVEPTPSEAAELDAQLRDRVAARLRPLAPLGIGPDITAALADPGCNAHLVGMLLSAIAATLVPSLLADDKVGADAADPLRVNTPRTPTPEVKVEHVP